MIQLTYPPEGPAEGFFDCGNAVPNPKRCDSAADALFAKSPVAGVKTQASTRISSSLTRNTIFRQLTLAGIISN
jgi:hypothetical protein